MQMPMFEKSSVPMSATAGTANETTAAGEGFCAVCADDAHGVHFGVQVCRACAAFFRRSTIAQRVYRCRYDGNCAIDQREVRCACRACRLAKCLALGMDPNAVQRNRDQIGPRQNKKKLANAKRRTEGDERTEQQFRDTRQQQNLAKYEQLEMDNEGDWKSSPGILWANSHAVPSEEGQLYTPLEEASPAGESASSAAADDLRQWCLLQRALPSAFAPPPAQPPRHAADRGGGGGAAADDSGNSSASSSLFELPPEQHIAVFGVAGPFCLPTTIQPQIGQSFCDLDNEIPLISEILRGYRRFQLLRLSAFHLDGILPEEYQWEKDTTQIGNENGDKPLLLTNYSDNMKILRTDVSLGSEMMEQSFLPPQNAFSVHSKMTLLRNFIVRFFTAERSHLTTRRFPPKDTRFLLSPFHFLDIARVDHFFTVEQCKTQPKEIARLFEETFRKTLELFSDFHGMRISDEEFAGVMGILFWDDKLDGLSAEESAFALRMRERLFAELFTVCSRGQAAEDGPATQPNGARTARNSGERFCTLVNKVHFSRKIAQEFSSHFSLANVMGSFEVDPFLHQFNPQAF